MHPCGKRGVYLNLDMALLKSLEIYSSRAFGHVHSQVAVKVEGGIVHVFGKHGDYWKNVRVITLLHEDVSAGP
jgi:hypothetical protein